MRYLLLAGTALLAPLSALAQTNPCPTPAMIPNQPAPAALAGYNTLTFGPAINVGRNWFLDTQHGGTPNVTKNADGSLTVSGGGDTWNGQVATATPTWPGTNGMTFGGGFYAQATMTVPGPTAGLSSWTGSTYPGNQWPSFWANGATPSGGIGIETDIVEQMAGTEGQYGSTVINWTQPSGGQPNTGWSQNITAPNGNTLHGPNTYGMLWIPATATSGGSLTFYLNDNPVGQPITWTQANPGNWGLIDQEKMTLYFGAGGNSPATFSNIEVWQASTAGNSLDGGPAPAIAPGTAAPVIGSTGQAACEAAASQPALPSPTASSAHQAMAALAPAATATLAAAAAPPAVAPVTPLPAAITTGVPSPNGTVVTVNSQGALTDGAGNVWTIDGGARINVNGVADPTTDIVVEIAQVNGVVWQENAMGLWWYKTAPDAFWLPIGGTSTSPFTTPLSTAQILADTANDSELLQQAAAAARNGTALTPLQQAALNAVNGLPE